MRGGRGRAARRCAANRTDRGAPAPPPTALPATQAAREAPTTPQVVAGSPTPSPLDERDLYALALAARATEDLSAAAEAFARVDAAGGILAPIARLRRAQALAAEGRDAAAADAFEQTLADERLPGVLRATTRLEAAEILTRLTREEDALALFDAVALDPDAAPEEIADARWRAARLRRERDDPAWTDDARASLLAAPWSTSAVQALDSLEASGGAVAPLTAGYVRYRARDDDAAAAAYLAVVDSQVTPTERAVAWFYLGAIAERAGDTGLAIDRYGRSLALDGRGWLADDARWWRGRLFESTGRLREAAGEYDLLSAAFPASPFTPEAVLRAALALHSAGDRAEAESRLRRLATTTLDADAASAARWLVVVGAPTEDTPTAAALDPASLPALLDAAGAGALAPLPPGALREGLPFALASDTDWREAERWMSVAFRARSATVPEPTQHASEMAFALAGAGEPALSRTLLRDVLRDLRDRPHRLLDLGREASDAGLHDIALGAALRLLAPLAPQARIETPPAILMLAYPAPYRETLVDAAEAEGVPPLLLLALVRQESSFNPYAVSTAGARGLTQVMPATAAAIAGALGLDWRPESLFEPETSLRFGARYLAAQLERFDGNVLAALAAYNGGPVNARRWLERQRIEGPDGYVLAIQFEETALYLELVLESYGWYRFLYADAPRPLLR